MMSSWIWLYVILNRGSGSDLVQRTPHPTYASCFAALKTMRIEAPKGNENEIAVVAYCGTDAVQRHYSATWWKDEIKDAK